MGQRNTGGVLCGRYQQGLAAQPGQRVGGAVGPGGGKDQAPLAVAAPAAGHHGVQHRLRWGVALAPWAGRRLQFAVAGADDAAVSLISGRPALASPALQASAKASNSGISRRYGRAGWWAIAIVGVRQSVGELVHQPHVGTAEHLLDVEQDQHAFGSSGCHGARPDDVVWRDAAVEIRRGRSRMTAIGTITPRRLTTPLMKPVDWLSGACTVAGWPGIGVPASPDGLFSICHRAVGRCADQPGGGVAIQPVRAPPQARPRARP